MTDLTPVPNLRPQAWKTVLAIALPVATLVAMFSGFVWQAARYPDRSEFNVFRDKVVDVDKAVSRQGDKLENLDSSVKEFKGTVTKQLDRIENNQSPRRR